MSVFEELMRDSLAERRLNAWTLRESVQVSNAWRIAADSFVPTITSSSITVNVGRDPWRSWSGRTYDDSYLSAIKEWRDTIGALFPGTYLNGAPDRPKEPETFDTGGVKGFLDGIEVNDDR